MGGSNLDQLGGDGAAVELARAMLAILAFDRGHDRHIGREENGAGGPLNPDPR